MESPVPSAPATDDGIALRAIARMRWRIRWLRAARAAIELTLYGVGAAVLVVLAAKFGKISDHAARRLLVATVAFPLLGVLTGLLRKVPALTAAQLLDRAYDLKDRLSNALEFRALPESVRTPMMNAALADAAEQTRAKNLRASKALAWKWPRETGHVLAMSVVLVAVGFVEFRTRQVISRPVPPAVVRDPLLLDDDDIEAFRDFARDMEQHAQTDEARDAVNRFNQFINQLDAHQLDREDAFRRLQALQEELERDRENDREELRDALRELGNHLDENHTTQQLAEALRQPDPRAAANAMHQLAEQLRQNRLNQQQRQELQQALQRAMQQRTDDQAQRDLQRAREEVERLLRQQRERQLSENEQRNLRQRQRDLERLQRNQQQQENRRRQLERLSRSMSQAMQDLARDLQQAAQDMDEGAQDLNRMSNEQLSDEQIAELRQQLEDLRQRMRQQNGQGGQQQRMRMQRFSGQARGGVMPGGMEPGGQRGRLRLALGGGGQGIPIPMGAGQGQQGNGGDQQGNDPGGTQAGTQHDDHIRGASTSIHANLRTVNVAGQQSGNGPSRSQVIRTAAQDGFTSQQYRQIHAQYWEHAREVVHAGDVPPGYRSYVRHYFQLIRPRDE